MRGIFYELTAPRVLEQRSVDLAATPLAPTEILAQTEYSVVSPGTELAAWLGKSPLRPSNPYPRLMGYCNVARVLETGAAVEDVRPGDHILTHQSHRSHFRCLASEILVTTRQFDGATLRGLATTYLFHLGYVALLSGGYSPGHRVAVVGFGALGLTTASLCAAFGAQPLIVSGRDIQLPPSLAHARVLRKSELLDAPAVAHDVDIVVNTSDSWEDYRLGLTLLRMGGTLVLLGFPGRDQPAPVFNPLDSRFLYDRQLTIKQAGHAARGDANIQDVRFTLKRNMQFLHDAILAGTIDTSALTGWPVQWTELASVYERLAGRSAPAATAVLAWA